MGERCLESNGRVEYCIRRGGRFRCWGGARQWLLVMVFAGPLMVSPALAAGGDSQLWTNLSANMAISRRVDLTLNGQLRTGGNMSQLVRESIQVGCNWKILPYLTFSPSYQYIDDQPAEGSPSTENRLSFLAAVRFPIGGFKIGIGNGIDVRFRSGRSDSWRYRPRFSIEHRIGPDPWGLSGYLSDEGFYDSQYGEWTRNRFYAGFKKKLTRVLVLDLYYMRQDDDRSTPGNLNVLGTAFRFYFDMTGQEH